MILGKDLPYDKREQIRNTILNTLVKPFESEQGGEMWMYHPDYLGIKVSSKGKVVNYYTNHVYTQKVTNQGYYHVQFTPKNSVNKKVSKGVHRLVAECYFPYIDYTLYEANHLNGDKSDNSVYNINWLTREENLQHARDTGLFKRQMGESNGRFKYSQETVDEMCEFLQLGFSYSDIAESYNISLSSAYHVISRRGNK